MKRASRAALAGGRPPPPQPPPSLAAADRFAKSTNELRATFDVPLTGGITCTGAAAAAIGQGFTTTTATSSSGTFCTHRLTGWPMSENSLTIVVRKLHFGLYYTIDRWQAERREVEVARSRVTKRSTQRYTTTTGPV